MDLNESSSFRNTDTHGPVCSNPFCYHHHIYCRGTSSIGITMLALQIAIMWKVSCGNQSRQQHRSFGDSTGISLLKSDGLGFGTAELCLSQYWFRNNYPDYLVIPHMFPAFASILCSTAALQALISPLIRCTKQNLWESCLFWNIVRVNTPPPPHQPPITRRCWHVITIKLK